MGHERTASDLLDELAKNANCNYLSDLREGWAADAILKAVSAISASQYSMEIWDDAVFYITRERSVCPTQSAYQAALINYLELRG